LILYHIGRGSGEPDREHEATRSNEERTRRVTQNLETSPGENVGG
jgi:hypothetical protein